MDLAFLTSNIHSNLRIIAYAGKISPRIFQLHKSKGNSIEVHVSNFFEDKAFEPELK